MFDNLTVDDIVRIYSEAQLDEAIRGVRPNPLDRYARLMMENERKRPFSQITLGCT